MSVAMRMEANPVGPRSGEQAGGLNTLEKGAAAVTQGSTAAAEEEEEEESVHQHQQPEPAPNTDVVEPAPEPEPMQTDYDSAEAETVQSKRDSQVEPDLHVEREPDPKPQPVEPEPEPELRVEEPRAEEPLPVVDGVWKATGLAASGATHEVVFYLRQVDDNVFGSDVGGEPFALQDGRLLRVGGRAAIGSTVGTLTFEQVSPDGWSTGWHCTVRRKWSSEITPADHAITLGADGHQPLLFVDGTWTGKHQGTFTAVRVDNDDDGNCVAAPADRDSGQRPMSAKERKMLRRVFRGSARRQATERLGGGRTAGSPSPPSAEAHTSISRDSTGGSSGPEVDTAPGITGKVPGGDDTMAPTVTDGGGSLLGWVSSKVWGAGSVQSGVVTANMGATSESNDQGAAAVSTLRQEMQAKIQKELDEIAAATPGLLDNLQAYPAPVRPSRPVLGADDGSETDSTTEDEENSDASHGQKHRHINASRQRRHEQRRRKRKKAAGSSQPGSLEEEMAAFFYELEQAGILTPNTVLAMAEYLEIHADTEWQLLWIAQACALEPLPTGWTEQQLEDGKVVYTRVDTSEDHSGDVDAGRSTSPAVHVQSEHPWDSAYRELIERERVTPSRKAQPWMQFFIGSDPTEASDSFWVNWQTGSLDMDFPFGLDEALNNAPILTFAERARRQQRVAHGHDSSSGLPREPSPATALGAGGDDLMATKTRKKKTKKTKKKDRTIPAAAEQVAVDSQLAAAEALESADTARRERQAAMSAATSAALGWAKRQSNSKLPEVEEGDEDAAGDQGDLDSCFTLPTAKSGSRKQDANHISSQETASPSQQQDLPPHRPEEQAHEQAHEQEHEHGQDQGQGAQGQESGQERGSDPQQGLEQDVEQDVEQDHQEKGTGQAVADEAKQVTSSQVVLAPSTNEASGNDSIRSEAAYVITSGNAKQVSGKESRSVDSKQSEAKSQPAAARGEGGLKTMEDNSNCC